MSKQGISGFLCAALGSLVALAAHAVEDMPGSRDHPQIPRLEGAVIWGYAYNDYDAGRFVMTREGKYQIERPEGVRTRIFYLAPSTYSVPSVLANYGVALEDLGEVNIVYSCEGNCPNDLATNLVWREDNRVPTRLRGTQYLYQAGNARNFTSEGYGYATVTTDSSRYHVSVYTALFTKGGIFRMEPDVTGTRSVHVEILEESGFTPTLQVVSADEIVEGLVEDGRIALYGIFFDFDSDTLRPDSKPALDAIAAALEASPDMRIYVAGHTDNQGEYQYNMDLSKRRAGSVVAALTRDYGIDATRLTAVGVGPVAPVASNRTEEGQGRNRRVELVER